jgi:MATE family multidrug resistance protein
MAADERRALLKLGLTNASSMAATRLLRLIDTFVVSNLGVVAVAGLGLASTWSMLASAGIAAGLSGATTAICGRRLGAGRREEVEGPLVAALWVGGGVAIVLALVIFLASKVFVTAMAEDARVVHEVMRLLPWFLASVPAQAFSAAFDGYWNGINRSHVRLPISITGNAVNTLVAWAFVYGAWGAPALGIVGAGVGMVVSTSLVVLLHGLASWRLGSAARLWQRPRADLMFKVLRTGLPIAGEFVSFSLALTVFFSLMSRLGTSALAASTIAVNFRVLWNVPLWGFGWACSSFVSQAIGQNDLSKAKRWVWEAASLTVPLFALLTLPFVFAPRLFSGFFIHGDEATLLLTDMPIRMIALVTAADGVRLLVMYAAQGAGSAKQVMYWTALSDWGLWIPAVYLATVVLGFGVNAAWAIDVVLRAVQAAGWVGFWLSERWTARALRTATD